MNKINIGGRVVDQCGTFKRNKSEIIKEFENNNENFTLFENIGGFYNKALIYQSKENKKHFILISYNTIVTEIKNDSFIIWGYYSRTTATHIDAFLYKNGLKSFCKKEIEALSCQWLKCKDFKKGV